MAKMSDENTDERMNLTIGVTFLVLVASILLMWLYKPNGDCEMSRQKVLSQADIKTEMQVRELMRELERKD